MVKMQFILCTLFVLSWVKLSLMVFAFNQILVVRKSFMLKLHVRTRPIVTISKPYHYKAFYSRSRILCIPGKYVFSFISFRQVWIIKEMCNHFFKHVIIWRKGEKVVWLLNFNAKDFFYLYQTVWVFSCMNTYAKAFFVSFHLEVVTSDLHIY